MPNKLIGTLIALFFFGSLFNISTFFLFPDLANAQLSELTEIQNSTFHLSHKNMGITSETFKNDKYIDDEQAEYFSNISSPELIDYPDNGYPFTLIDHYVLNSDLEITYDYDKILCSAYPQKAYLSRHDISITDYTEQKSPPELVFNVIKGKDPYTGEIVEALYFEHFNHEVQKDEMLQKSVAPGDNCYSGIVINTYINVKSGFHAVWLRDTLPDVLKKCNASTPASTCLHPSDIRPKPEIKLIVISSDNPCIGEPYLPEAPRNNCYYPFPSERTSAAATNWSYNNNLRNGSSSSSMSANSNSHENSQTTDSSCKTCK